MAIIKETEEIESSFMKGWEQVKQKDVDAVRADVMAALHFTSYPTWVSRLYGRVAPKQSERAAIEQVFAKYGITDVWGE